MEDADAGRVWDNSIDSSACFFGSFGSRNHRWKPLCGSEGRMNFRD